MPLALLEHVNLNIPDRDKAHAFYVEALGGLENPKTTNERQLHVNVGASQFHLLLQYSYADGVVPVKVAQVWSGHIELWSRESLHAIKERMDKNGSECMIKERGPGGMPFLLCSCPWGNKYIVRTAPSGFNPTLHGAHPGGSASLIAMTRVVHLVPVGLAKSLYQFWTDTMDGNCELVEHPPPPDGGDDGVPKAHCIVRFASGQQLIFDEKDDAPPANAYDLDEACAYHIALYIDHVDAFAKAFEQCETEGRLYANPRFAASPPEFGNAMSWDAVETCGQFRIKDLSEGRERPAAPSPPDGFVLEVEVRSVSHRSCPLTRADKAAGGVSLEPPDAFAGWSPLQPPPHAKPGVIRIPHGRGGFGAAAKELAAEKRKLSPVAPPSKKK